MADEQLRLEFVAQLDKFDADIRKTTELMAKMRHEGGDLDKALNFGDKRLAKTSAGIRDYSSSLKQTSTNTQNAAAATSALAGAAGNTAGNLPRLRYALYDVSTAFAIFGAAALAAAVAPAAVAISWDRAFADVRRTVDGSTSQLDRLEQRFVDLAQTIPVSFKDLAEIGTLAGQLNVPANEIVGFTDLVAKFAATTDVSIDASATAFARLSQLLPPLEGGYEALGSSILKVGINSIATESEIINISTQIAGIGNQAGLTADEVFGLSAALASLGIRPELARGTVTRLFGNIGRAISSGGVALEDFGKIAGMSADQFKQGWNNAPTDTLLAFLNGIGTKEGPAAEAALRAIGITSVRDVPAILRLAQNLDLVKSSLGDAAEGAAEGTELNRQYGIIAETAAEKLTLLNNNFQALLNSMGQFATNATWAIDALNWFLKGLTDTASNPFWGTVLAGTLILSALVGVFALLAAGAARGVASLAALATANMELGTAGLFSASGMRALNTQILGTGTLANVATKATHGLGVAIKSLALVGAILISLEVAETVSKWAQSARGGVVDTDALTESFTRGIKTTETFQKALTSLGGARGTSALLGDTDRATLGLKILGDELNTFLRKDFFPENSPLSGLYDMIDPTRQEVNKLQQSLIDTLNVDPAAALAAWQQIQQAVEKDGGSQQALNRNFSEFLELLGEGTVLQDALSAQRESAVQDELADQQALSDQIKERIGYFTDEADAAAKSQDAIHGLGQSLRENGSSFEDFSEAGRENLNNLLGTIDAIAAQTPGDAAATANNLNGLFNAIVDGGYASAQQLVLLSNIIAELGGATGSSGINFGQLNAGFKSVAKSAGGGSGGAAKAVRTLVDYANDLQKIMSRSFDIRFGAQDAIDGVTEKWAELNDEMADYQQKVLELTADKNIKEYFLSVANAYGDTLRAGVLTAELGKISSDLADAQAGASKELTGNSKAAIKNRKTVTDLVKGYQDYIESLAASGASQSEISAAVNQSKNDFIAQATALGYTTTQLGPYTAAFNDMATAVAKVPRNVTVTANADPAIQALNEYNAALDKSRSNASRGIPAPVIAAPRWPSVASLRRIVDNEVYRMLTRAWERGSISKANFYRSAFGFDPGSGWKSGGYTGGGGTSEAAGVVHGKEFVFNAEATKNAGVGNLYGMMRAYEQGRGYQSGGYVSPVSVSPSRGVSMVELSPIDRRLLAAAGNVTLTLDGRVVADSTNNVNGVYAKRGA